MAQFTSTFTIPAGDLTEITVPTPGLTPKGLWIVWSYQVWQTAVKFVGCAGPTPANQASSRFGMSSQQVGGAQDAYGGTGPGALIDGAAMVLVLNSFNAGNFKVQASSMNLANDAVLLFYAHD